MAFYQAVQISVIQKQDNAAIAYHPVLAMKKFAT
jgi:hypothetical protein